LIVAQQFQVAFTSRRSHISSPFCSYDKSKLTLLFADDLGFNYDACAVSQKVPYQTREPKE
jgi:hypothetical protein